MLKRSLRGKTRMLLCLLVSALMLAPMLPMAAAVEGVDLVVLGTAYTRDDIAAMPCSEASYTYTTSSGERTDTVRGVLLEELLTEVGDDVFIHFSSVDNWSGMMDYSMRKCELVEANAMLAIERLDGDEWADYLRETDDGPGYFALYVEGFRVAHAVNVIFMAEIADVPGGEGDAAGSQSSWIGDATPEEHDVRIVGLVEKPGYFTVEGLKELCADYEQTKEYGWLNSSGSTDTDVFTGIYIEDLLSGVVKLAAGAAGILVEASDGFSSAFALSDAPSGAFWTDIEGNQMMLAWNGTASRTNRDVIDFDLPRIAIGQKAEDDVNRSSWASDIVEIRVTAFTDLKGFGWAVQAIDALAEAEVTDGVGDNRFDPSGNLTRAMFVTLLGRALDAEAPEDGGRNFDDVDYESWYGGFVEWAVDKGLVQGYGGGKFGPDDNLLVEHMLLIAQRAGLEEVPEGVEADAVRYASRAEAAVVIYALMNQG